MRLFLNPLDEMVLMTYEQGMPFPGFTELTPLAHYTTFKIGGPATLFAEVSAAKDLIDAVQKAREMGVSWRVIGHGSNVLASDSQIDAAIIVFKDSSIPHRHDDGKIEVSGGYSLWSFTNYLAEDGLAGLECLAGIPGTVGGAVAGNAGAYGTAMSDRVCSVKVLDSDGNIKKLEADELGFGYRHSKIKETGDAIISVIFNLQKGDPVSLRKKIESKLADRRRKHPNPMIIPTAGSFFKNPIGPDGKRTAAGRILEDAGCKELRVGNAKTWFNHANIIVTEGPATSEDVRNLADQMIERVEENFGIRLKPEVSFLD